MAKFQKGQPKPPGSGRKPGQASRRSVNRFCELLDGDGFKLKNEIRAAVLAKDVEWTKALAQLLRVIDTGATSDAPTEISDAELLQLLPNPTSA